MTTELHISGMTCSSCAQNVQRALEAAGGRVVAVDRNSAARLSRPTAYRRGTLLVPLTA